MASWVLEFQRQEYSSNLYKNNQNQNASKSEKLSPIPQGSMRNNQPNIQVQISNQSSQQGSYQHSKNEPGMTLQNHYKDSINQPQYLNKNKNTPLVVQKQLSEEQSFPKGEYQQNIDNNNNLRMNKTQKRSYSSSPAPPANRNNFNEEAELVGQLINIRKILPRSSNEERSGNTNEINNDLKNTFHKNLSSVSLQSMDMDDLNPEMIDKLLNNYNFESYQNQ